MLNEQKIPVQYFSVIQFVMHLVFLEHSTNQIVTKIKERT
jgi:hypothetical protein